ncbi:type III-A CRISPR-associated protein Cas10/Csm1 [Nostoc sp. 'Peltigera membranacea cyanobiont' N6]|uniref:type III-A CRISPR-associated protein Cas10/Csm1 n=1 Tax=Nostoc sp. 'Peltigera membranacea cyanobiont' N6 TaxID=1261031 RepID=UPI000CF361C6|nr:type III-A CRISPR-associated protein Cas10/Csm1 [Nostoc sp. 'Peltigera membranacea cyanobiont' N6]AVH61973.1 CRISPR-associated protein Cas10/Csm1 [Nostoc sp. 'Peltigera membranacea cyanobiont' N6]
MISSPNPSHQEALKVIQQAVWDLASWAGLKFDKFTRPNDSAAIAEAKKHLSWSADDKPKALRVLFDSVKLAQGQTNEHFWQPNAIANSDPIIPYPQTEEPKEIEDLRKQICEQICFLEDNPNDWGNISLLTLIIEKFGSFISFGEADVALVDKVKTTAAVAGAIVNDLKTAQLSIVAGDLSGIQNFIYTISSDGALKSLRARSFYLELVTEEVVAQLLTHLNLPRINVIYAGGGNIYILAPGDEATKTTVQQVRLQFNQWLREKFQGKIYLALDSSKEFPVADIGNDQFSKHWSEATKNLASYKARKFGDRIDDIVALTKPYYAHTPCKVCHRDDEEVLKPLNEEPGSAMACSTCRTMFGLGGKLFRVDAIVRSRSQKVIGKQEDEEDKLWFQLRAIDGLNEINVCYQLFSYWKQVDSNADNVLLVNDWDLEHYKFRSFRNCAPILLGNYGKKAKDENRFMRAEEMADISQGIKRVGYLRMDVDRLGQIFAKGLDKNQTLARLAGLSRQMSYFFKVYLNSLAANRENNIPENIKHLPNRSKSLNNKTDKTSCEDRGKNILFIYAGGDDLFVSGAWNEIVDFSFDIYQCFRAYTGHHPDITLSAGVSITDPKFPLYQAADESGDAEGKAKNNGRDSLGLFNQVFKWDEWLGIERQNYLDELNEENEVQKKIMGYLKKEEKPPILGILPFVERLESQNIGKDFSRNFVRNLLITAQVQEQALKKIEDQKSNDAIETRYYLHLPKIAYTLARLPQNILEDDEFRTSLKNPYNAPYFRAIATWIELLNR